MPNFDTFVQIAHNCVLGNNIFMASQSGVAGSVVMEDDVEFAGGVQSAGHLTIGKGVKVIKNITSKTVSKECEEVMLDIPNNPVRVITPYNDRSMLIGIDGFGVYQASRIGGFASPLFSANEGTEGGLHGNLQ